MTNNNKNQVRYGRKTENQVQYPNPQISVIMPVYNADRYLEEAIQSILNQTYDNFELIIVCSSPTKKTTQCLTKYQSLDSRVIVHYQEKNGIISARNYGCHQARGKYIAILDADDTSIPERFETQLKFLQENSAIGIVGSWVDIIDQNGDLISTHHLPSEPYLIGWHLFLGNCIMHSSVLMRTEIMKELNYYSKAEVGFPEDYDLWVRAFSITKIANIPKPLTKYRIHNTNDSSGIIVKSKIKYYRNVLRNDMIYRVLPNQYISFLERTAFSNSRWVLSFDYINNNYQVELLETLFHTYSAKFSLSKLEVSKTGMYVWAYLIIYLISMFPHSKFKCCALFIKSLRYLSIKGILFFYNQYCPLEKNITSFIYDNPDIVQRPIF